MRVRLDRTCPRCSRSRRIPGSRHLVSTVRGRLRPDVGLADLVRATFPPASVTGAPKPRVLQAIEDLEPVRRGVYCGAFGWVDGDARRASSSRSRSARSRSPAAAPISGSAAASSPTPARRDEWAETELKGARLLQAAGARRSGCTRTGRGADDRVDRRRARARSPRPRCRCSTTDWSSATASSRRSGSTAACRSRGPGTSRGCARRRTGLGLDAARRHRAARRGRRGAARPTSSPRRGCASP